MFLKKKKIVESKFFNRVFHLLMKSLFVEDVHFYFFYKFVVVSSFCRRMKCCFSLFPFHKKSILWGFLRCKNDNKTKEELNSFASQKILTYALSFYRSQNVLGWSKFFVSRPNFFFYILWQSHTFCARQKDYFYSVKLVFVPAQKFLKRH